MLSLVLWIAVAYFSVRGLLASLYDFTSWVMKRNGIDPDAETMQKTE